MSDVKRWSIGRDGTIHLTGNPDPWSPFIYVLSADHDAEIERLKLESVAEAECRMQEHIAQLTDALDSAMECALAGETPTPEQVKGWAVVLGERAERHGFGAEQG